MEDIEFGSPFIKWLTHMIAISSAQLKGKDIILNDYAARQFCLAAIIDGPKAGTPILGILMGASEHLLSIKWSSAALMRGHENRDWVALSCKDARNKDSAGKTEVPIRLWIPVPIGSLDVWKNEKNFSLEIRRAKNNKKGTPICERSPLLTLPLTIKNKWEDE